MALVDKTYKSMSKYILLVFALLTILILSENSFSESFDKPTSKASEPEEPAKTIVKKKTQQPIKKYEHHCPAGTEQVGKGPPVSRFVYCRQQTYQGPVRQGKATSWYSNGKKFFEGDYVNDKKHGQWITYTRTGRKKISEDYYNGQVVKRTKYDKDGVPVEEKDPKLVAKERREKRLARLGISVESQPAEVKKEKAESWCVKQSSASGSKRRRRNWN